MDLGYVEIVPSRAVQRFLLGFYLAETPPQALVLVSPIMGTLEGTGITLEAVCRKATERGVPIYAITQTPRDDYHRKAVEVLMRFDPGDFGRGVSFCRAVKACLVRLNRYTSALSTVSDDGAPTNSVPTERVPSSDPAARRFAVLAADPATPPTFEIGAGHGSG